MTRPGQARDRVAGDLQTIPYVGPAMARDLRDLGCRSVGALVGRDPERMYEQLCELRGGHVDRCVLYVLRSAVYWASTELPDPELSKWWNWKDGASRTVRRGEA